MVTIRTHFVNLFVAPESFFCWDVVGFVEGTRLDSFAGPCFPIFLAPSFRWFGWEAAVDVDCFFAGCFLLLSSLEINEPAEKNTTRLFLSEFQGIQLVMQPPFPFVHL